MGTSDIDGLQSFGPHRIWLLFFFQVKDVLLWCFWWTCWSQSIAVCCWALAQEYHAQVTKRLMVNTWLMIVLSLFLNCYYFSICNRKQKQNKRWILLYLIDLLSILSRTIEYYYIQFFWLVSFYWMYILWIIHAKVLFFLLLPSICKVMLETLCLVQILWIFHFPHFVNFFRWYNQ